ncbi:LLM class flavin-dependent oxidoreductase [Nocardia sp. NPDC005978]|uniref:LLM class flavin-dependent oxidoreductase n=1 Tax=Nocardia sp. NPDC005978 TaxID=3156725 RepID=UPI0033A00D6E
MTPRLSVSLPLWQDRDPLDALAVAAAAADLGYDRLWIGEMATFDAFALATAVGRTPGDLPLCVGPLAVAIRTPATIAMGAASVAALTGRPVAVALGTSSPVVVTDWHGRERTSTAAHLEDTALIVRDLLAGAKVDYKGHRERIRGFHLRLPAPRPVATPAEDDSAVGGAPDEHAAGALMEPVASVRGPARPGSVDDPARAGGSDRLPAVSISTRSSAGPTGTSSAAPPDPSDADRGRTLRGEIAVAAFGARALSVGARVADRVVLNLVTPAQVARCVSAVREFAAAAGRPAPAIAVWVTAGVDPTPEMLATLRRGVVGYLRAPGYAAMFTEAGFGDVVRLAQGGAHPREVLAAVPDELPAAIGMLGDAGAVRARLAEYRAAGADEVVVVPVTSAEDPAGRHTLRTVRGFDRD